MVGVFYYFRVSLASEQCRVKEQLIKVSLASHKITQYSVPVLILSLLRWCRQNQFKLFSTTTSLYRVYLLVVSPGQTESSPTLNGPQG